MRVMPRMLAILLILALAGCATSHETGELASAGSCASFAVTLLDDQPDSLHWRWRFTNRGTHSLWIARNRHGPHRLLRGPAALAIPGGELLVLYGEAQRPAGQALSLTYHGQTALLETRGGELLDIIEVKPGAVVTGEDQWALPLDLGLTNNVELFTSIPAYGYLDSPFQYPLAPSDEWQQEEATEDWRELRRIFFAIQVWTAPPDWGASRDPLLQGRYEEWKRHHLVMQSVYGRSFESGTQYPRRTKDGFNILLTPAVERRVPLRGSVRLYASRLIYMHNPLEDAANAGEPEIQDRTPCAPATTPATQPEAAR